MALRPARAYRHTDLTTLGTTELLEVVRSQPIPEHIAVIMDGNGRWAVVDAFRLDEGQVQVGEVDRDHVSEKHIRQARYTSDIPDPDLLIRTSGEMRVSNFLLWQIAYTELWVTPTLWPDFGRADL